MFVVTLGPRRVVTSLGAYGRKQVALQKTAGMSSYDTTHYQNVLWFQHQVSYDYRSSSQTPSKIREAGHDIVETKKKKKDCANSESDD